MISVRIINSGAVKGGPVLLRYFARCTCNSLGPGTDHCREEHDQRELDPRCLPLWRARASWRSPTHSSNPLRDLAGTCFRALRRVTAGRCRTGVSSQGPISRRCGANSLSRASVGLGRHPPSANGHPPRWVACGGRVGSPWCSRICRTVRAALMKAIIRISIRSPVPAGPVGRTCPARHPASAKAAGREPALWAAAMSPGPGARGCHELARHGAVRGAGSAASVSRPPGNAQPPRWKVAGRNRVNQGTSATSNRPRNSTTRNGIIARVDFSMVVSHTAQET